MAQVVIKNHRDIPLIITDPDKGEVYCVMPGFTLAVKHEWPDVKKALANMRGQLAPASTGKRA